MAFSLYTQLWDFRLKVVLARGDFINSGSVFHAEELHALGIRRRTTAFGNRLGVFSRHVDRGRCVGGDSDVQVESAVLLLPLTNDRPAD